MIGKFSSALPAAVRSVGIKQLVGATLVAAAAAAAPAHATVIDFEGLSGPVGGGDYITQDNYAVQFLSDVGSGVDGTFVGQFFDGGDSSCDTSSMDCPANSSGTYYGALNDSLVDLFAMTGSFVLQSFDASFIGGNASAGLSSYPNPPGLIRVQAFTAAGNYLVQDFWLNGPSSSGFNLNHYATTGDFANTSFVEAYFFGFACNTAGNCSAFNTDRGQFALDNITLAVPEPASAAIVGLGLLGLGAARRRKS